MLGKRAKELLYVEAAFRNTIRVCCVSCRGRPTFGAVPHRAEVSLRPGIRLRGIISRGWRPLLGVRTRYVSLGDGGLRTKYCYCT